MKIYLIAVVVFTLFVISACKPAPKNETEITPSEAPLTATKSEADPAPASDSAPNPTASNESLDETDSVENDCTVNIGFDVWEPYQYVTVNDEVRGMDIELIGYVMGKMGCELTYTQGTWVLLLKDLQQGNIDILLGASKTESREEYAHFSDSYRMEEFSLYIRKGDKTRFGYDDIDDFIANKSKIGIVEDYYYGPRISILLEGSATSKFFLPAMMGEMNVGRLLDQDIDGFLEDSFVGASMLRRKGLNNYIEPHGFTVVTGDIFVMFSKETISPEQVDEFNKVLTEQKYSDGYQLIMQKYSK